VHDEKQDEVLLLSPICEVMTEDKLERHEFLIDKPRVI